MNVPEKNAAIKAEAIALLSIPEDAIQIGDYDYAIPVTVDGELRFAKLSVTAASNKDTKTTTAFDADTAHAAYLATTAEKKDAAMRKAAEKAAKPPKTKKKTDEDAGEKKGE